MSDWNPRANALFVQALEIEVEAEQGAFLDQVCGEDQALRREIEGLLRAYRAAGDFMENSPSSEFLPTIVSDSRESAEQDSEIDLFGFLSASDKTGCLGTLGQYEVVALVGRGGMGIVLRAFDPVLNRVVAIKVMAPELAINPMAVKRFLREAQAAAAVSHQHVVTIFGIEPSQSPPFLVMEYIDGQSLQEKIDSHGALEPREILRIGAQVAAGLAAAHQQGLVHRDIKPANILLENGVERVKITDFGLARAADDVGVTTTGQIPGTPQYMSPEQALGNSFDLRTDLFSLGSVMYTMCTGRPAFRANNAVAMLRRVVDDQPRSITEVNPDIPDWLEQIIMRLLAKQPENRYDTALEVADLLNEHLAGLQNPASRATSAQPKSPQPEPAKEIAKLPSSAVAEEAGETETTRSAKTDSPATPLAQARKDPRRDLLQPKSVGNVDPEWKLPPGTSSPAADSTAAPAPSSAPAEPTAPNQVEPKSADSPAKAPLDQGASSAKRRQPAATVLGIDLGTTNSMICYLDKQSRPCPISNVFGELLTPSALLVTDDEILVGREALRRAVVDPNSYADSFKRDMGAPYYRQKIRGENVPPEALSGWVLRHLKKYATEVVGEFQDVVITVPAFFDESRRRCTQEAGLLAGLNVVGIINEPTAAALAYAYQRGLLESNQGFGQAENILVYDLGGGTFDVTILTAEGWHFRAVATDGDVKLGGRDFDERIVNYVAEQFVEKHGVDPRSDLERCVQLWVDAEQAKHTLSTRSKAMIPVSVAGIQMNIELTRDEFQTITADLVGRTHMSLNLVLKQAQMKWGDIDRILLVGGATRMPAIRELIQRLAGKPAEVSQSPDEVVAHGAALYAGIVGARGGPLQKVELANINSHSVGVVGRDVQTGRQQVYPLIRKNSALPASATQVFPLAEHDQRKVTVPIMEGESRQPGECNRLGTCVIDELPANLPSGTPVTINFLLTENGLLTVTGEVTGARRSARLEIARKQTHRNDSLDDWQDLLTGKRTSILPGNESAPREKSATEKLDDAYCAIGNIALHQNLPKAMDSDQSAAKELAQRLERGRALLRTSEEKQTDATTRLDKIRIQSEIAQHQTQIRQWEQQLKALLINLGRKCFDIRVTMPEIGELYATCKRLRT